MDQNKYIEVRIFEPFETAASDTAREYSIKALSTIHECDSTKVSHNNTQKDVLRSLQLKPTIESFPSSNQRDRYMDKPLDIDLLLRYYACNSNMEKSINKVLEKASDHAYKDVDRGPLIELGAVCKIFEFLRKSSSKNSLLSTFRFHDILTKLESLVRRCSGEALEQILSSDPTMKMCKHCGVISCLKPRNASVESRRSPPKTSYFLSTQLFPDIANRGDDRSEARKRMKITSSKKEQAMKRNRSRYDVQKNTQQVRASRDLSLTVKRENIPQHVETMVAEREKDSEILGGGRMLEVDRTLLQNHARNSKEISKGKAKSGMSQQIKAIPNFENKDKAKSDATANFMNNLLCTGRLNQLEHKNEFISNVSQKKQDEWKTISRDQLNVDVSSEKVVRDILYERPKLDHLMKKHCLSNSRQNIGSKQSEEMDVVNDKASSIDLTPHLAHGHFQSVGVEKKEFVSQFDKRTSVHSGYANNDKHSFILHNNQEYNPYSNSEFLIRDKLMPTHKNAQDRDKNLKRLRSSDNHLGYCKYIKSVEDLKPPGSFTCLMEDDSLENCIKVSRTLEQSNESNTTTFSSSSAENMIREWVKVPQNSKESNIQHDMYKSWNSSKLSIIGLNTDAQVAWINEKRVYCVDTSICGHHNLQAYDAKEPWSSTLSTNEKIRCTNEQIVPNTINDSFKHGNFQEPLKDKVTAADLKNTASHGSKKRSMKRLIESFKNITSIKSIKSIKSKEMSSSMKVQASSSNSLLNFQNISRRIIYNESSLKNMVDQNGGFGTMDDVLLRYRKLLESTEEMDWQSFQQFVENLHPNQKNLWRNICKSVNNKIKKIAKKSDGNTEICIEISSAPIEGAKHERKTCSDEIVFEMDITFGDVERCLGRHLPFSKKEQLDTLNRAGEVIKVRNDNVCDIEAVSNQAE